jgi:hypothetical protein
MISEQQSQRANAGQSYENYWFLGHMPHTTQLDLQQQPNTTDHHQ